MRLGGGLALWCCGLEQQQRFYVDGQVERGVVVWLHAGLGAGAAQSRCGHRCTLHLPASLEPSKCCSISYYCDQLLHLLHPYSIAILPAHLLLLRLPDPLGQSSLADARVHVPVLVQHKSVPHAQHLLDRPVHDAVAPVRRDGSSHVAGGAREPNLSKRSLDKLLRRRDHGAGLADLAHGAGNKVSDGELGLNTVGLELCAQRGRPVLKEGLGARVGGQQRSGEETTERAHGEDKTALAVDHAGGDNLGDLEGALDVDGDDVLHLGIGRLEERDRDVVALSDVVDQDGDIKLLNELGQTLVVGGVVLRKVHGERLGTDVGKAVAEVLDEVIEFGGGAGNEDEVEPLLCELDGKLLANAVGGSSNNGPGALGSKLSQLPVVSVREVLGARLVLHWFR